MTSCQACGSAIPDGAASCPNCPPSEDQAARTAVGRATDHPGLDDLFTRVRRDLARDYDVHSELGRGGMAVVYRATELELLRPVALKVLPPELSASAAMSERFRREARLAASFDHPNIIPIYRVGQSGGVFYIAMKFVEGRPLDALIEAQGPLPVPVVLHVLRAAVRALAFAHQHGVIHRDIKGANILIDQDGRVVVSDFGIARAGEDAGLTATGTLMGTPYFMSPEQCAGHRVGQQSDQYSLGVVAFQMLTGTVPFHAETIPGVMQHHFFTPVPDVRAVRSDIPEALVAVLHRALAKRAVDRFTTTREMHEAIDAIPFDEADRRTGEAMLRDLVLGVALPRVNAGKLPPLQDTLLMTPPPVSRARVVAAERRGRHRTVMAAAAAALVVAALGYQFVMRPALLASRADTAAATLLANRPDAIAGRASADSATPASRVDGARGAAATASPILAGAPGGRTEGTRVNGDDTPTEDLSARPPQSADRPSAVTTAPSVEPVEQGKIRVRVLPSDAEIVVDGRLLGRGIVLDSLLASGTRRLRASAPGYQVLDTTITVLAGATNQVGTLRLVPESRP